MGKRGDMTQNYFRKLAPKDRLDEFRLLSTLIETLPEQVYIKDVEGRYVLNNLAHLRALGAVSPQEIAGKSDCDFYPEELAERYQSDDQEVIRSGRPLIDQEELSVDVEGNERRDSTTKAPVRGIITGRSWGS
jgi:two-component system sensor histidine kinase/response regulator